MREAREAKEWLRKLGARQEAQTRRFQIKLSAVEYKGGKCELCGYNRSMRAFDFHHKNPQEKDFSISDQMHLPWELIKQELDKCMLLCSNCHREVHDGLYPHLNVNVFDELTSNDDSLYEEVDLED